MKTAVVILNWNTAEHLRAFLPGVIESVRGLDAEVVVADNGSTDASRAVLAGEFPSVRTVLLEDNFGFTGGNNRAVGLLLEEADAPEYIVLMNSDIDVGAGWLEPLVSHMDAHQDCGVCSPVLHALLRGEDGAYVRSSRFEYAGAAGGFIDRFGFPFCRGRVLGKTEEDCGQYGMEPLDAMWVSGACLMTRSSLWSRLGGLDDRFFAHMEEIDYCWRASAAGYGCAVIPSSTVWHLGGGTLPASSPLKLKLNWRNSLLMLEKCLPAAIGGSRARRRIFARMVLDGLAAVAYLLCGRPRCFRAVIDAHAEYRALMAEGHGIWEIAPGDGRLPATPLGVNMILQYALRGKRIFKYLRDKVL